MQGNTSTAKDDVSRYWLFKYAYSRLGNTTTAKSDGDRDASSTKYSGKEKINI